MTNVELIRAAMLINGIEEESHTYAKWKQLGFQVKKGEKAAFKTTIWKHQSKKIEVEGEEKDASKMFMKTAHFFTKSQVQEA